MKVTLGINNCFAVKRWPQPAEWAGIIAEELGLDTVQHSLDLTDLRHEPAAEADAITAACRDAGLRIDSVFTGLAAYSSNLLLAPSEPARDQASETWAELLRFAARLGAHGAGGHTGSLSQRDALAPVRRRRLWSELQDRLEQLARLGRDLGLEHLLVENMACRREPCTMEEIDSLLTAEAPDRCPTRLCLDVGHHCVPGLAAEENDPYAWLRRFGAGCGAIHLQQSDAEGDHHWPFTPETNRRGRIQAERVLGALEESGATSVTLLLEIIPPFEADDERVLAELRDSVAYWQSAIADRRGAETEAN